ncbi:MAG: hypothetical protein CME06_11215 [Gemmatimonadetes bacterium]|nr:hypothetical protein [Gemmatimonadota bacterium]
MKIKTLAIALAAIATVAIGQPSSPPKLRNLSLSRRVDPARSEDCLAEEVYLLNHLETATVIATLSVDRPSILPAQASYAKPAIAEVLVGAGDAVFVAKICPRAECRHDPRIVALRLIDARVNSYRTRSDASDTTKTLLAK